MKPTLVIASILLLAATASQAQWAGSMTEGEDGLLVVNPEEPVTAVRVEPRQLWERGGEDDDIFFGRLSQIVTDDDGNLYVLDSQLSEVVVFTPDGEYLRTVGREGEGPGEFVGGSDMFLGPNGLLGIVRIFPGRIYQLGTDGSPADFFPLPKTDGFQLVHVARANKDLVVVAGAIQSRAEGKQIETAYLKAYGADGNEVAHYCEEVMETQYGGMQFDEKTFSDFARRWTLADDGRVAVAMDFDKYRIDVYNADGTLDRVIIRPDYRLLERTSEEKERMQTFFDGITRWNPNSNFKVSDTHATVSGLWFRDDGHIWVMSSRGARLEEADMFASIDEYDRQGRYVRRLDFVVEGDPVEDGVFFIGDRLYRVTDLFSSFMAALGGDESSEEAVDLDPLRLVAYQINLTGIGMK
jgi:hypothetical protein